MQSRVSCGAVLAILVISGRAVALPVYSQVDVGLTDAEHTRDQTGQRYNTIVALNNAGRVAGRAVRFGTTGVNGTRRNSLGYSAWLYDGVTTLNVGLTDAEHTSVVDGERYSTAQFLNSSGQVAGTAQRYDGLGNYSGATSWFYDGAATFNIGLTDAEHTEGVTGDRVSSAIALNDAGQVAGFAYRSANAGTGPGQTAWLFDGITTRNVGLVDDEHTSVSSGERYSYPIGLNSAGQIAGQAYRYDGAGNRVGVSAWLYDGTTTRNISVMDAEHTILDSDARNSYPVALNDAGQVAGIADRFDGNGNHLGQTAWLYDGAEPRVIGLVDAEHTSVRSGERYSYAADLNAVGQVAGFAYRYDGAGSPLGQTAWLYDGNSTADIGLTDVEHSSLTTGERFSEIRSLNDAGQVAGDARRYDGVTGASLGSSAWLHKGATTINIGLLDNAHTNVVTGERSSTARFLNSVGQVVGEAYRYDHVTGEYRGLTAWFYDGAMTHAFDLGHGGSNEYGFSQFRWLSDDEAFGVGYYDTYDALSQRLGIRGFGFDLVNGFFDLGDAVAGGLAAQGWDRLGSLTGARGPDWRPLGGHGFLAADFSRFGAPDSRAYLLSASREVPESGALTLVAVGLLAMGVLHCRKLFPLQCRPLL
ncbi:MAG: DUF3466 family protein [Gammaproteobacteria bacterium]|nr:DUF3466 family protein [Gammaproteobacteria bacterium]